MYRDTLLPSSETFIREQAESLGRFRAEYACLRRTPGTSLPEDRVHTLCPDGVIGKLERIWFKVFGPFAAQRLIVERREPLLLHAHFAPDGADIMPVTRSLRIPLVVSLHGYDVNSTDAALPRRYVHRRERLMGSAARFICVSQFVKRQALINNFPAHKTLVHYTGIDTLFFSPGPRVTAAAPTVLFVGRLAPEKGCEYLIRAMNSVQQAVPEAKLIIIGDGAERQKLETVARAHLRNVAFLGAQPLEIVRMWMARATVFSAPCCVTENNQEGFGMVFAEAQAMGLPVVSCAIGGIPEAVSDGQTGFLVPERNWEALVPKLLLLLRSPTLRATFGAAGRARVHALFDIRKQATRLEELYLTVLSEWKASAEPRGVRTTWSFAPGIPPYRRDTHAWSYKDRGIMEPTR